MIRRKATEESTWGFALSDGLAKLIYIRIGFILLINDKNGVKLTDEFRYPLRTLHETIAMSEITNKRVFRFVTRTI